MNKVNSEISLEQSIIELLSDPLVIKVDDFNIECGNSDESVYELSSFVSLHIDGQDKDLNFYILQDVEFINKNGLVQGVQIKVWEDEKTKQMRDFSVSVSEYSAKINDDDDYTNDLIMKYIKLNNRFNRAVLTRAMALHSISE